ncbi:MAG TPA: preprotein translocase subunit SecG [bacterium]
MLTFITAVHIVVCIFLILVVLMQMGKGAELSSMFGGSSSQSVFGSSGPGNFLEKLTIGAAIIFMVTSVSLFYLSRTSSIASRVPTAAPSQTAPLSEPEQQGAPSQELPAIPPVE